MPLPGTKSSGPAPQIRRKLADEARPGGIFSRGGILFILVFGVFAALIIEICFAGLSPAGPQVVLNQTSRARIIAEIPFSYVSDIETERMRAEIRQRTPPVYRLDQSPAQEFRKWTLAMDEALAKYLAAPGVGQTLAEGPQKGLLKVTGEEMDAFLKTLPSGNRYNVNGEDLAVLTNTLGNEARRQCLEEGLRVLSDLYRQGIYGETQSPVRAGGTLSFMKIADSGSGIVDAEVLSREEALSDLKINIGAIDVPREAYVALFRVMRAGLEPNLIFDQKKTNEIIDEALSKMEPRVIRVRMGDTVIEPGTRVGDLQFEALQAYRKALRENDSRMIVDSQFFDRAMMAVAVMLAAAVFIRMRSRGGRGHIRDLVMACMAIAANLLFIRILLGVSEGTLAQTMPELATVLPWLAPVALAPILMAVLMGPGAGALTACIIAAMSSLMQGGSFAVAMAVVLSGLAGVYACRDVQVRTRVVRAGLASGLTLMAVALVVALRDETSGYLQYLWLILATFANGFLTGVVAVGLLPIFEHLFRRTTDITLLELTDFNHPLLRRLQVAAPGSYHHSLMVANLAENAAIRVGANPLACRAASLYHDIGKMIKPEYFIENQREGNPHMERNPSMSALIIKAHVKEGVVLARQYGLPKLVSDVIQQHHGTSLIQYFYYLALQRQQDANAALALEAPGASAGTEVDEVAQSTYRYEGPKPQFLESAIVMLADTTEAASRSLKKVTPQSVEDFVNHIVQGRIDDGQLDEAPITMRQIAVIKESFVFTLLNMLHSRIEYPKGDPLKKPTKVSVQPAKEEDVPDAPKAVEGDSKALPQAPVEAVKEEAPAAANKVRRNGEEPKNGGRA